MLPHVLEENFRKADRRLRLFWIGFFAAILFIGIVASRVHPAEPKSYPPLFFKILTVIGILDVLTGTLAGYFLFRSVKFVHWLNQLFRQKTSPGPDIDVSALSETDLKKFRMIQGVTSLYPQVLAQIESCAVIGLIIRIMSGNMETFYILASLSAAGGLLAKPVLRILLNTIRS
ncbi:hypothetical protein JW948_03205 [bacterium]|nr:hypothetical protein [bacterium]